MKAKNACAVFYVVWRIGSIPPFKKNSSVISQPEGRGRPV